MTHAGLVVGNYRLVREIGAGGFGVVYEAIHVELGRGAAIKILAPQYARHPEVVARFTREARIAAALEHPSIVQVLDVGTLPTGEPFILMDLLVGRSLADRIAEDGPLPFDELVRVFGPLASAVAKAHAHGVIHRDLKPQNVMLLAGGGIKLLDFGISKLVDASTALTESAVTMGTLEYMAPEQMSDARNVDARADVYAFAATVFAALAGRPPFQADSLPALLMRIATEDAPSIRSLRRDASERLDTVLSRCLAKDPAARPSAIDAAWSLIEDALQESPPARRRGWAPLAIVAPAACIAAVVAYATLGGDARPSTVDATATSSEAAADAAPVSRDAATDAAIAPADAPAPRPRRQPQDEDVQPAEPCGCGDLRVACSGIDQGDTIVAGTTFDLTCKFENASAKAVCASIVQLSAGAGIAGQTRPLPQMRGGGMREVRFTGLRASLMMSGTSTEDHSLTIQVTLGECPWPTWKVRFTVTASP